MRDIAFLGLVGAFFAVGVLVVRACETILGAVASTAGSRES